MIHEFAVRYKWSEKNTKKNILPLGLLIIAALLSVSCQPTRDDVARKTAVASNIYSSEVGGIFVPPDTPPSLMRAVLAMTYQENGGGTYACSATVVGQTENRLILTTSAHCFPEENKTPTRLNLGYPGMTTRAAVYRDTIFFSSSKESNSIVDLAVVAVEKSKELPPMIPLKMSDKPLETGMTVYCAGYTIVRVPWPAVLLGSKGTISEVSAVRRFESMETNSLSIARLRGDQGASILAAGGHSGGACTGKNGVLGGIVTGAPKDYDQNDPISITDINPRPGEGRSLRELVDQATPR